MNGNSVISIQNQEDLSKFGLTSVRAKRWYYCAMVWMLTRWQEKVVTRFGWKWNRWGELWVWKNGVKKKRSCAQEEREEQVKDTIDKLREKHGTCYSPMQFRIWSEMIQGGIHSSLTDCPTSSMFVWARGETGAGRRKMIPLPALVRLWKKLLLLFLQHFHHDISLAIIRKSTWK